MTHVITDSAGNCGDRFLLANNFSVCGDCRHVGLRGSLNDEPGLPGADEPMSPISNILNDEPGNGEPFAKVENEWLQLPVIYKRVEISD